ncbi:unnamed protein product [Adineta ricciae]|uniref:G-protein coupled receptors family 1 profile domain-containing protein n=1 Tax=Adineta ricciae TaxID=249248 RepID=A0A815FSA1_ADIRI|nr:unnamed protein product [Adineta ricciae]
MWIAFEHRFWLFLVLLIPSTLCGIFNLYQFLFDRILLKGLHNHIIILLNLIGLLYNLTDIIWFIYFYRNYSALVRTKEFCFLWFYSDYTGFLSLILLGTWAAIERHILIFHQDYLATKRKRFLFHYLPMILILIYSLLYYPIVYISSSCRTNRLYSRPRCGLAYCISRLRLVAIWDNLFNNIIPTFLIVIFSIALILRVFYSKYRINQRFRWKNYQKLTIQSVSISFIYIIFYFPSMILNLLFIVGALTPNATDLYSTSLFFSYFVPLFIPLFCTISLPELRKKFQMNYPKRTNHIAPQFATNNQLNTIGC